MTLSMWGKSYPKVPWSLASLKTKTKFVTPKQEEYFVCLRDHTEKQAALKKNAAKVSERVFEASFQEAKLRTKSKKPHTVADTLILL